jgi:hypothetical protein
MGRGCYGCFGPSQPPNTASLTRTFVELGVAPGRVADSFRFITGDAQAFRDAADRIEREEAIER